MSKTYIGIDPGLSGGFAILDDSGLISYGPIPTKQFDRRRTVDTEALASLITPPKEGSRPILVAVESAQKHSAGTNALSSTWFGFGRITAMLEMIHAPFHIIAAPRTWQKAFWTTPKLPKGQKFDTKAASIEAAKRLFPGESFLPTTRCSKPSDGITDAILIAEFARRNHL